MQTIFSKLLLVIN